MTAPLKTNDVIKIGAQEATFAVCIAIVINTTILACLVGTFSNDIWAMLGIDATAFLIFGISFGCIAARLILLKRKNYQIVGIACAWTTLIFTAIAHVVAENMFYYGRFEIDGALSAVLVVFVVGFIPSGIHGIVFGYRVFKKGQKT